MSDNAGRLVEEMAKEYALSEDAQAAIARLILVMHDDGNFSTDMIGHYLGDIIRALLRGGEESKTLILVSLKSGDERRINSAHDAMTMLLKITSLTTPTWGFVDVDGSCVIINSNEFESISLIPQESSDNATPS